MALKFKLTQEEVQNFSPIDVALYKYFNESLWVRLPTTAERCASELAARATFPSLLCAC